MNTLQNFHYSLHFDTVEPFQHKTILQYLHFNCTTTYASCKPGKNYLLTVIKSKQFFVEISSNSELLIIIQ